LLAAALELAELGLPIVPIYGGAGRGRCGCGRKDCSSPAKHPRTKHGHKDASRDASQIAVWWNACTTANVGVRTGEGLVVLDVDPRNGGASTLGDLVGRHGALPNTWTVQTGGGGMHFYFRADGLPTRAGLFTGIDFKSHGGFVVAPPSVHASGKAYRWARERSPRDLQLAGLPDWIRKAVLGPSTSTRITEGGRNTHLASFAGKLRRAGLVKDELLRALTKENARSCTPPLELGEVQRIAASIEKYNSKTPASAESMLATLGLTSLTKESSSAELEEALRRLRDLAPSLDVVQRSMVRIELVRKRVLPSRVVDLLLCAPVDGGEPELQGRPLALTDPEPWPEPVRGDELLDELTATVRRHVVLSVGAGEALALWVLHTHAIAAADITPRLAILSPEKRCGKTTLLKVLGALVRRPLQTTNVTTAALFRTIEKFEPTLLVDEADTFLSEREELRGILNSGHDRQGAQVVRCVGEGQEVRCFNTWAPVAIAAIGAIPETLHDRSVVVQMKRRRPGESVAPLRRRNLGALVHLPRQCARWVADHRAELEAVEVVAPPGVSDRAADNWEPLLAIAHLAGGSWTEKARALAVQLSTAVARDDSESRGQLLLADVRQVLLRVGGRVSTQQVVTELNRLPERPWGDGRGGKGISVHQLCRAMRRFGAQSRSIRFGESTAKGFVIDDLADAFARYLADETGTPAQQHESGSSDVLSEAAQRANVPVVADDESSSISPRVPVVPVMGEHDDPSARFERADSESTTFNESNGVNHGRTRYDA
jgi:putative DNA primase/helicase